MQQKTVLKALILSTVLFPKTRPKSLLMKEYKHKLPQILLTHIIFHAIKILKVIPLYHQKFKK